MDVSDNNNKPRARIEIAENRSNVRQHTRRNYVLRNARNVFLSFFFDGVLELKTHANCVFEREFSRTPAFPIIDANVKTIYRASCAPPSTESQSACNNSVHSAKFPTKPNRSETPTEFSI